MTKNSETYVLLLTGGIGSGKSEVARYLRERGVGVYDSDSRTKALYRDHPELVGRLERELGVKLVDGCGVFSPRLLSSVIFADAEALSKVEGIVHPAVLEDFERWKDELMAENESHTYPGLPPFVVMESAIALQKPLFKDYFDAVIIVTAPLERRIERAVERDSSTREKVLGRIGSQWIPDGIGMNAAVVNNDLDLATLHDRTDLALRVIFSQMPTKHHPVSGR